jgi:hypothetical protein
VCVIRAIELHGSEMSKIGCIVKKVALYIFIDRSNNQNFKNIEMLLIQVKVHLSQQSTPNI